MPNNCLKTQYLLWLLCALAPPLPAAAAEDVKPVPPATGQIISDLQEFQSTWQGADRCRVRPDVWGIYLAKGRDRRATIAALQRIASGEAPGAKPRD